MNSCCPSGFLDNSATSVGKKKIVNGLPCCISELKDRFKVKTAISVPEILGYKSPNLRLLADEYKKKGLYAYVPNYNSRDALPYSFPQSVEPLLKKCE